MTEERIYNTETPVHDMFGLTYANYYVVPRSVLQSMPVEWQKRFCNIVDELKQCIEWEKHDREYHVIQTEYIERQDDDEIDYKVTHCVNVCSEEMEEKEVSTCHDEFAEYRHNRIELKKIPQGIPIYYFGCIGTAGHHTWAENGQMVFSRDTFVIPWRMFDTKLAPQNNDQKQGECLFHQKDNWSCFAFWDRSVDLRRNSNSIFFIQGNYPFTMCLEYAKSKFPQVFNRLKFDLVRVYENG